MLYSDPKFLEVLKLLDELLASENPTVRELIDQAILVQTMENPNREREFHMGPFQQMFHEVQQLRQDINRISGHQTYYSYPNTVNTSRQSWTGGVGAGPMVSSPSTFTIGNISLDSMARTTYDSSYFTDTITLSDPADIDWNKYFSNYVKTEVDGCDPKPAEDYYDPAKAEDTATAAKLQELLDKLKY